MNNEDRPRKEVPYITTEEDEKPYSETEKTSSKFSALCDTDKTSSSLNITKDWEQGLKEEQQKHDNDRDKKVTFWGFLIVSGVLLVCAAHAVIGTLLGVENLFRDFFALASTSVSLVLGYLFGSRSKK